jgi:hypothetical protein
MLVTLGLVGTASAAAQTREASLVPIVGVIEVRSGDPCLDVRIIAEQVTRWLHRDAIDARINVLLRPSPSGGESIEVIREGSVVAERTFDGGTASCAERQAALGLMIALALDATIVETLEPEAITAPPETPAPEVPVPSPTRVLSLDAAATVAFGSLPEPAGGGTLMIELSLGERLALRFGASALATGALTLERGRTSSTLVAARFAACTGASISRFRAEACGGVSGGTVLARGRGFTLDERAVVPWLACSVGGAGRVALGSRIALRLAVDLVVPIVRAELAVVDVEGTSVATRTPPPIAAELSFGVVLSFP